MLTPVYDEISIGGAQPISTLVKASGLAISGAITAVQTSGYTTAGDGGGAIYIRSATQPSHAGKFQDALGQWWTLAQQRVSLRMFGAFGNGLADDTAAINNWIAYWFLTKVVYVDAGKYKFTVPIIAPSCDGGEIIGAGFADTIFLYTGANTTNDLMVFGDGTNTQRCFLSGFAVDSSTVMTGGYAVTFRLFVDASRVDGVIGGDYTKGHNVYNGVRFDTPSSCFYTNATLSTSHNGLTVHGTAINDNGADLFLDNVWIVFCGNYNMLVGGGFGGLYTSNCLFYGGVRSLRIDQTIANRGNREMLLGTTTCFDGANTLIEIDNAGSGLLVDAGVFLSGAGFVNSVPGDNLSVINAPNGRITLRSQHCKAATRYGVVTADATTQIFIASGTYVTDCQVAGVFCAAASTDNIFIDGIVEFNLLNVGPNIRGVQSLTGVTLSAQTGALTSAAAASRKLFRGITGTITTQIVITTNGTGAGSVNLTLPFNVKDAAEFNGARIVGGVVTGQLIGYIAANTAILKIYNSTGSYPGADGVTLALNGFVETY